MSASAAHPQAPLPPQPTAPALPRTLDLQDLVAYGLAYIAPIAPLTTLGFVWAASGGLIALSYLLGVVCMLFTVNSYVQMSREHHSAGSAYGFAQQVLGNRVGFLTGWLLLLDYLLIPALVHVMMSIGMEAVVPGVGRGVWLSALAAVTLLVNWRGITVTSRVNQVSVVFQLLFMAGFLGLCVWKLGTGLGQGALTLKPFHDPAHFNLSQVVAGTGICVLAFLGFDAVSTLAEETRTTDRGLVGRATALVMLISGALFVLSAWVLGNVMPAVQVKDAATASFDLAGTLFGPAAVAALAVVMIFLVGFTNALPMQAGVARVLFAMGRDRQLPGSLGRVHPKYGTPHVGMLVAAAASYVVAFALLDHAELLTSIVNFGALGSFALLHVAVIVHFKVRKGSRRLAHGLAPALGLVIVLGILSALSTTALLVGGGWLVLGGAMAAWRNRKPQDPANKAPAP